MAIKDIVTGGFGSFSSVNKIPTRGFSIGDAVITTYPASVKLSVLGPRSVELSVLGPRSVEVSKASDN